VHRPCDQLFPSIFPRFLSRPIQRCSLSDQTRGR
jgi:hypothetical protein